MSTRYHADKYRHDELMAHVLQSAVAPKPQPKKPHPLKARLQQLRAQKKLQKQKALLAARQQAQMRPQPVMKPTPAKQAAASAPAQLRQPANVLSQHYGVQHTGAPASSTKDINLNLSIKLRKPSIRRLKRVLAAHKGGLARIGVVAGVILIGFAGINIFQAVMKKEDKPQVAGANYIAPKTVFLPRPLPEGFSIGSGSQELENGAVVYSVFGPDGETITITQHAQPANFDEKIFGDALRFNTPFGKGYAIEDVERTTGYLLAEDSWVLLNAPRGFSSDSMRTLIRAMQPTKE